MRVLLISPDEGFGKRLEKALPGKIEFSRMDFIPGAKDLMVLPDCIIVDTAVDGGLRFLKFLSANEETNAIVKVALLEKDSHRIEVAPFRRSLRDTFLKRLLEFEMFVYRINQFCREREQRFAKKQNPEPVAPESIPEVIPGSAFSVN